MINGELIAENFTGGGEFPGGSSGRGCGRAVEVCVEK